MAEAQRSDQVVSTPFDNRLDADGFNSSQRQEEMEYAIESAKVEDHIQFWLDALDVSFWDMIKAVEEWKHCNNRPKRKSGRPPRPADSVDRLRTSIRKLMNEGKNKTDACRFLAKNDPEWKGLSADTLVNISGPEKPRKSAQE